MSHLSAKGSWLRGLGDLWERLSQTNHKLLAWIPACAGMTAVFSFLENSLDRLFLSIGGGSNGKEATYPT